MLLSSYTYDHYHEIDTLIGSSNLTSCGYFCTLRFRPKDKHGRLLTDDLLLQNTSYFFHHLNSRLFGKAYTNKRRTKPRLKISHMTVCHRHKSNITQSHIHSIIFRPAKTSHQIFIDRIHNSWSKTLFGFVGDNTQGVDIQKIYSRGIISYLFNEQSHYDSLCVGLSL